MSNSDGSAALPYNLRPDAFAGTASYYVRYRLPYPSQLIDDLRNRTALSGSGRLLDLGCGPGRVALALAPYFREVLAVDLDPEMVDTGRREAERRGQGNLIWHVGRVEELAAPRADFDMITMGEAFHRFDQPLVLRRARSWLAPGGFLVTLGAGAVWEGRAPWQVLLKEVLLRWKPPGAATGHPSAPPPGIRFGRVMADAGFVDLGDFDFPVPHVWTVDSLIGYAYSTSAWSKRALGAHVAGFEDDMRRTLLSRYPQDRFPETVTFSYTLARRPDA